MRHCQSESGVDGITILRGVQFIIQTQEGVNWIVFSSEPISFAFDTRKRTDIVASKIKGTIRLAVIPPSSTFKYGVSSSGSEMVQISSSTGLRRLVYHAAVYPVASRVEWDFRESSSTSPSLLLAKKIVSGGVPGASSKSPGNRIGGIHFHFTTKTATAATNSPAGATVKSTGLLMLALPHHVSAFSRAHILDSKHFDFTYHCIKGSLTPIVGSSWSYEEKLPSVGFDGDLALAETFPKILESGAIRDLMLRNLEADLNIALPSRNENIYSFAKQLARLAQLAHIATRMAETDEQSGGNNTGNDNIQTIKRQASDKLVYFVELLLSNQLSDSLVYDASLGGIVSTDGLNDWNMDFGNGRYSGAYFVSIFFSLTASSTQLFQQYLTLLLYELFGRGIDHHYQWGYILYSCAILGSMNATFVEVYGQKVDAISHDVAYNSKVADGSFFPTARHFNFFDGHSYQVS